MIELNAHTSGHIGHRVRGRHGDRYAGVEAEAATATAAATAATATATAAKAEVADPPRQWNRAEQERQGRLLLDLDGRHLVGQEGGVLPIELAPVNRCGGVGDVGDPIDHQLNDFRLLGLQGGRKTKEVEVEVGMGGKQELQVAGPHQAMVGEGEIDGLLLTHLIERAEVDGTRADREHGDGHFGFEGGIEGDLVLIGEGDRHHHPAVTHRLVRQKHVHGLLAAAAHGEALDALAVFVGIGADLVIPFRQVFEGQESVFIGEAADDGTGETIKQLDIGIGNCGSTRDGQGKIIKQPQMDRTGEI